MVSIPSLVAVHKKKDTCLGTFTHQVLINQCTNCNYEFESDFLYPLKQTTQAYYINTFFFFCMYHIPNLNLSSIIIKRVLNNAISYVWLRLGRYGSYQKNRSLLPIFDLDLWHYKLLIEEFLLILVLWGNKGRCSLSLSISSVVFMSAFCLIVFVLHCWVLSMYWILM